MLKQIFFLFVLLFIPTLSVLDVYIPQCAIKFITKPINYTLSNFGYIPYGETYIGKVYKPSNQNNIQLCQIQNQPKISSKDSKSIMLVKRGGCKFTQKVLNAQKLGANFVIVYDNEKSTRASIIMKNDGHGHLVTIPSVFISSTDGQAILQSLRQCSQSLVLRQVFDVFETDIVSLQLWLSLDNRQSYVLLRDFYQKNYYKVFEDYVNTDIRFKVNYGCQLLYCDQRDCIGSSQNQYCLPVVRSEDQQKDRQIVSGSQLLKQSLRMFLLFQLLPLNKNFVWFHYMDNFDKNLCFQVKDIQQCSYNTMKQVGASDQMIDAIKNKFEQQIKQINQPKFSQKNVFYKVQKQSDQKNVLFYPQAVINNKNFYGLFKAPQIFEMICSSLTQQPKQCFQSARNRQISRTNDKSDDLWLTVILIISLMTLGFLVALFTYSRLIKRQVNQQMSMQVNKMVQNYVNLAQQKSGKTQSQNLGSFQKVQV